MLYTTTHRRLRNRKAGGNGKSGKERSGLSSRQRLGNVSCQEKRWSTTVHAGQRHLPNFPQQHGRARATPTACWSVLDAGRCIVMRHASFSQETSTREALKVASSISLHNHQAPTRTAARLLTGPPSTHTARERGSEPKAKRSRALGRAAAPRPLRHEQV